jgi:Nitroreductase family
MFPFEDGTSLSLLYHLNSEPWGNVEAYQSVTYEVEYKQVTHSSPPLSLPTPSESDMTRLARKRYSCRAYEPKMLPLSTLSALLWGSYGITRTDAALLGGALALMRPVPSAGGLFPLEVYVATQQVQDLPDGLHHYNVRNHALGRWVTDLSSKLCNHIYSCFRPSSTPTPLCFSQQYSTELRKNMAPAVIGTCCWKRGMSHKIFACWQSSRGWARCAWADMPMGS